MLYNLPTGKTIELSVEHFLDLTDEELEYLISVNYGEAIENPFFGSILESSPSFFQLDVPPIIPIKISEFPIEELDDSIDFTEEEE